MLGWPESEPVSGPYYDPYCFPDEAQMATLVETLPPPQAHHFLTPPALPAPRPAPVPMPTCDAGALPVPAPATLPGPVPVAAPVTLPGPVSVAAPGYMTGLVSMPRTVFAYVPANESMLQMPSNPESSRERRNKAEKQRRDRLNQSIGVLSGLVSRAVGANGKIDKTSVLRLTAHCIRGDYAFGPKPSKAEFSPAAVDALLEMMEGFVIGVTYKGLVVVVSPNVKQYLGYSEVGLFGKNIIELAHEEDRRMFRERLMPHGDLFGAHGELLVGESEDDRCKMAARLDRQKRAFTVRFRRQGPRWEPTKYVQCHVQGSFKMSEHVLRGHQRCGQPVRRARARSQNPYASGNDVMFIGCVRPMVETFRSESELEAFRMEYRTRHSVDGAILTCDQRIALVAGYMTCEVEGANALSFIHRDDVKCVIVALREMYNNSELYGQSCYRLQTRAGDFVYMSTRGWLEVDPASNAVASFVCTNSVVDAAEGRRLVSEMKHKLKAHQLDDIQTDRAETNSNEKRQVEDPKTLQKAILNLVTDLPSPGANAIPGNEATGRRPSGRLSIIAPERERIINAIEKTSTSLKMAQQQSSSEYATSADPLTSTSNATQCDDVSKDSKCNNVAPNISMGSDAEACMDHNQQDESEAGAAQAAGRISPPLEDYFNQEELSDTIDAALDMLENMDVLDPNLFNNLTPA